MATRVFFCYDTEDLSDDRVELVRRHWISKEGHQDTGIFDDEELRGFTLSGSEAIKRLIVDNLMHSSVTCVLIGNNTWRRRWVRYAIVESIQRGNRLLGVYINGIPDRLGRIRPAGRNPFDLLALSFSSDGSSIKVLQYANGDWAPFVDNAGWVLSKQASEQRRGRSLQLSSMYRVYDWVKDDGPGNLEGWLIG